MKADTVTVRIDSIAPVKKKQPLDAPVVYESNDSTVFTLGGAATLYGSGKVNYQNIELAAEVISMNLDSSTVHAYGIKDTTGVEKGKPVFKEGDTSYDTETIRYNFKTTAGVVHISRHNETGRVTAGEWEEEKRHSQRQRHIFHNQIGRSCHHILFRAHLSSRQLHIEVGMIVMIAGCITPMLHENFIIGPFLTDASR